jgi:DNA-directed RNA polymerase subunit RPC12/RpoP
MKTLLKPCAKCGHDKIFEYKKEATTSNWRMYWYRCAKCGHESIPADRKNSAIDNWEHEEREEA